MTKQILLVEDEPILALTTKTVLEKNGYSVLTARNGERATEISRNEPVDLILMDIDLGRERMDGCETAKEILKEKEIPIIFRTSHQEKEMVEKVKGITRYGYVIKASGTFVLLEAIQMAFELFEANRTLQSHYQHLQEREARLSAIFRNTLQLFILVDKHYRILELNETARNYYERLLGKADVVGDLLTDLILPDHKESFKENFAKALAGETVLVNRIFPGAEGELTFRFCFTPVLEEGGEIRSVVFTVIEITDLKQAERQLHFQANILDEINESVIVTRPDGEIIYWNRGADKLFGWSAEEALGKNIIAITPSDMSRNQAEEIMAEMKQGKSWSGFFQMQKRDGTSFTAHVSDKPVIEKGELTSIIGITTLIRQ